MIHRRIRPEHAFEGINATPLIDVVMCLIIFFLLVGKLVTDREKLVKLPDTLHGESTKSADPFVIDVVKSQGQGDAWLAGVGQAFIVGNEIADVATLERAVRDRIRNHPDTTIEIRADRELPYGAIEPVLRACARAGGMNVRLATEKRT